MKQMFSNKAYDFRQNLPIDLEIPKLQIHCSPNDPEITGKCVWNVAIQVVMF